MSISMSFHHDSARLHELLRYTFEIARIGTWERDLVTGALWWSDEFRELLKIPADEPASREIVLARIHPEDRDDVVRGLAHVYTHGEATEQSFRVLRPDGLVCRFQTRVKVESGPDGRALRAIGTLQDVTIQLAVEEELRRQTAYLTAILNHLPQGISVFDEKLYLQYWNANFAEVLDLPDDLLYRNVGFDDLIMVPARRGEYGPGDPVELVRQRRELATKFEAHRFERTRPNGRTHLVTGEPMLIDGRIAGFITTYTDITELKNVERALERQNQVLQSIIDNIPCGVSLFDKDLCLLAYNEELKRVLGLPDVLFEGRTPSLEDFLLFNAERGEYGPGDPVLLAKELAERALKNPRPHSFERIRPDGTVVHVRGQPLADGGFVTIYSDITELRRAERSQVLADKVFENTPEAIVIIGLDHRIVTANPAFASITGYDPQAVIGDEFSPGAIEPDGSVSLDSATIWRLLATRGTFVGETAGLRADGSTYPRALTMTTVRDSSSTKITHFIAIFTDITERKRAEADIQHLAHHDALTGLANRYSLYARLEQSIADAKRNGQSLGVLFLDLDRFKDVNDSLGHHVGDALLVQVGRRLLASVREADTVARLGGDEFVVVLPGVSGASDAARVAGNLLRELSEPYVLDGVELHAIPSMGISLYPDDSASPNGLLRNADAAMYHAKALGRGNYQFFTEELNRAATERLKLEAKLRRAVTRKEFELWYQPLFDASDVSLSGFEALLRWRQEDGTLISPDRFIPLAEETGVIVELGHWVITEACRQLVRWQARGLSGLRMSVNLSTRQLRYAGFTESVAAIVSETGIESSLLELEITESSVMERPAEAIEVLKSLKASGVSIAIDDFGTGYSSLSYLKLFPLDRLKIDRSFVSDIETDANDAAIVTAAVSLAHNLGLRVVAEGVETETQIATLRKLGCDELQGFYFSKPLPADEAEAFIRCRRSLDGQ